ncbi:acetate kinase [Rhizoctonia solani AG-1 IA]|uniref:Probable acetate kinase n=1 Tax=Thanatephorus cucumeris (strain AG1-IA) TaxID=983506 RepID=L8WM49_THACA|nr:acetate kinase [Rhizoctonia solani AG-1 IA]
MSIEMLLAVVRLYSFSDLDVLISGTASNVEVKGAKPSIKYIVYDQGKGEEEKVSEEEKEDEDVFERVIALIEGSSSKHFVETAGSKSKPRVRDLVKVVAHRVVHGGTAAEPMGIWPGHEQGLEEMDALSAFAPLHHIPKGRQILLFDTMFHSTIPAHIYTYPLGPSSEKTPIPLRKYGAHGLSYASILDNVSSYLNKPKEQCTLVIAHLGSGASVCLVKEGKSWDTSMGLTPLDGLPGGTRTGSVDPVLVFHHTPNASEGVEIPGGHCARGEVVVNKQGGLQALAGTSNFGEISSAIEEGAGGEETSGAQLAYDVFLDRLMNYVGAYVVKAKGLSSGLDAIVFSGGIGEKSVRLRADVGKMFSWIGCKVDQTANEAVGNDKQTVTEITGKDSGLRMLVCLTDEETQCARMAKHAYESKEMK